MIDHHKAYSEWKIQLIMRIIFVCSLDTNEIHIMHTKSDNIEIMNGAEASDAINELFNSFLRRYQEGLETKMKGSGYIFGRVDLLEYDLHKISLNREGSYIDSSELLKNKTATINPKNTRDNKCMQYTITVALHHQKIGRYQQRISKIKPFIKVMIGKIHSFPRVIRIGENLNKIIRQLLLISYLYHTILSK